MSLSQRIGLYLVVLISGACVMVFELVMPRLFAPYFGTSTYIWTMAIGVVMASLSLGYYLGGKLADKKPGMRTLAIVFLAATALSFVTAWARDWLLVEMMIKPGEVLGRAARASLLLLAPVGVVLGMVTPLAVEMLTKNRGSVGRSAGNVYALSTLGSIGGTFAAGFWLIPSYGVHEILLGVSLGLGLCTMVVTATGRGRVALIAGLALIGYLYLQQEPSGVVARYYEQRHKAKLVAEIDTQYNRVWIHDYAAKGGFTRRVLTNGQSERYLGQPVERYLQEEGGYLSYYGLAPYGRGGMDRVLMIGGGAYTFAEYLLNKYAGVSLDVVEIDPELLGIARDYFEFEPSREFGNYVMDGRVFLNGNNRQYDVILLDAYQNGNAIPFQLTTKEAFELMYSSLSKDGLLMVNVISSLEGKGGMVLKAEYQTMKEVFGRVEVLPVGLRGPTRRQNLILVGMKGESWGIEGIAEGAWAESGKREKLVMTDDYAPLEYFDLVR